MFTAIGDVHGENSLYLKICSKYPYTVQIGDMGFTYDHFKYINPDRHKFFGGNHDNYDIYYQQPHSLGNYGSRELNGTKFWFMRGAFSIDWMDRNILPPNKSLWAEQELSYTQMIEALEDYKQVKPELVLSHDCPTEISKLVGNPRILRAYGYEPDNFLTCSQECLQQMFDWHKPKLWLFGHFHRSWNGIVDGCEFRCLRELETYQCV